jgi:Zn-dependent peptidase ImmA (M78 family)/transcriptional regulator with XRE-family HTH domain
MSTNSLNPDLMKVARQSRALSQSQLAEKAGLTQGHISKMESGVIVPAVDAVQKVATALDFPVSFFFETDRVFGLPVSLQYRKKASVGQRAIEQLEADINLRLFALRRLLRSVNYQNEVGMPHLDPDEFGGAEAVASVVRRSWLVPTGPIRNLVELVELAGCVVIHCDFQAIGVDGLTLKPAGLPYCMFINSAMPADRQRFTIAHELGHVVMHQNPNAEMEAQADAFAAALLMPKSDIAAELSGGLSLQRIAAMKNHWRVSMGSLIYRAHTIGLTSENQNSYLWRQMSALGYRKREPAELDFAPEQPAVLPDIVQVHLTELGYSTTELSKALHLHEPEMIRSFGLTPRRAGLKLVGR